MMDWTLAARTAAALGCVAVALCVVWRGLYGDFIIVALVALMASCSIMA